MQTSLKHLIYAVLSVCLLSASISVYADVSAGGAGNIAKQHYGGKVIAVKQGEQGGRAIYRVKLLQASGTIQVIRIDRKSGQIIR